MILGVAVYLNESNLWNAADLAGYFGEVKTAPPASSPAPASAAASRTPIGTSTAGPRMVGIATRTAPTLAADHRRMIRDLDRRTITGKRTCAAIVRPPAFSLAKLILTRDEVS